MSASITDVAGSYSLAWAARDVDRIVALHTDDSVFHVHGLGEAASGLTSVRQLVEAFLGLVPDLHFDPRRVHFGADHVVSEYVMSGTVTGSAFCCDGVDVISVRGGLVARKDTYLDLATLQRRIGSLPDIATAGSHLPT